MKTFEVRYIKSWRIIISEKVQDKELISLINLNAKIKLSEGMKKIPQQT